MQTLQIRNSTAVFLIFAKQNEKKIIEVIVDEESVWLSQKLMAELFGTTRNNITMNLSNIKEYEHRGRLLEPKIVQHNISNKIVDILKKYSIYYEYDETNNLYVIYGYR